jgi:uncharacterized protein (DUF2384 family)
MPVLDERERAALVEADGQLSGLQAALETAVQHGALDDESIDRLRTTAEEIVVRVNANLPPQIDADARDEIRRRLIDMLTLGAADGAPLDVADRALIEAEAVRHIMRDLLQEQPPVELRDAADTLHLLEGWLPGLPVNSLAELVGMSTRQLQRRRQEGGASPQRLQLVARLVAILRHAWTDQGVYAWFQRERLELGGHAPIEVLDDADYERDLLLIARGGRVQGGS